MPHISDLTGAPWHKERMHREEGDARRHKTKCRYHESLDDQCSYYHERCRGSAHCMYYEEYRKSGTQSSIPIGNQKNSAAGSAFAQNESDEIKEEYSLSQFRSGAMVHHTVYGDGRVLSLNEITGKAKIDFFSTVGVIDCNLIFLLCYHKISLLK